MREMHATRMTCAHVYKIFSTTIKIKIEIKIEIKKYIIYMRYHLLGFSWQPLAAFFCLPGLTASKKYLYGRKSSEHN